MNRDWNVESALKDVEEEEAARLREVWDLLGNGAREEGPGPERVERARERLQAVMQEAERSTARRAMERLPLHRSRRIGWAAAAVVLAGAVGLWWWGRPVVEAAPPGEHLAVDLPDRSRAELNSGSTIRFARGFRDGRSVHLVGEAFFDVEAEARPFTVETFNARILVVGTRFNVRAWPDEREPNTTVALESGEVVLTHTSREQVALQMNPGETRQIGGDRDGIDSLALSVADAAAWKRGDIVLRDLPVADILNEIERRFDVSLLLEPKSLQDRRLVFVLRQPADAEMVVRDLAGALKLHFRPRADGYELYQRNP